MTHEHRDGGHHRHRPAGEVAPAGGPVVLDIGDEVGALLVYLPSDLVGHELHVRTAGRIGPTIHTGIWERTVGGYRVVVAVFPELTEGDYDVLDLDGAHSTTVSVQAGDVTEVVLDGGHAPS